MAPKFKAPQVKIPRWTNGMWEPIWKNHAKVIEQFVKSEGLQPAKLKILVNEAPLRMLGKRFPGIPVPHLHIDGKIFELSGQQWNKFATQMNKDMAAKLADVKPVGLGHIAAISNAIHGNIK